MTQGFNLFTKQCHYTTIFCHLCCAQPFGHCCPIPQHVWEKQCSLLFPEAPLPQRPGRVRRDCRREETMKNLLTLSTWSPGPAPRHFVPCRSSRSCSSALAGLHENGLYTGCGRARVTGTRHFGWRLREIRGERLRAPGEGCCFGVTKPTRVREELDLCSASFPRSGRHGLHSGHRRR